MLAVAEPSPEAQRYGEFFEPPIADLRRTRFAGRALQHFDHTERVFLSLLDPGIGYAASLAATLDACRCASPGRWSWDCTRVPTPS